MLALHYAVPVRGAKLLDELLAAIPACQPVADASGALRPQCALSFTAVACDITVPDSVAQSAVDAVVAAHNASTPSTSEQQTFTDTTTLDTLAQQYQTFKDGLTTIRGHMDSILAGPASPTATQTGAALKSIAGDIKTLCNGLDALLDDMRVFVRRQGGG